MKRGKKPMKSLSNLMYLYDYYKRMYSYYFWRDDNEEDNAMKNMYEILAKSTLKKICEICEIPIDKSGRV